MLPCWRSPERLVSSSAVDFSEGQAPVDEPSADTEIARGAESLMLDSVPRAIARERYVLVAEALETNSFDRCTFVPGRTVFRLRVPCGFEVDETVDR